MLRCWCHHPFCILSCCSSLTPPSGVSPTSVTPLASSGLSQARVSVWALRLRAPSHSHQAPLPLFPPAWCSRTTHLIPWRAGWLMDHPFPYHLAFLFSTHIPLLIATHFSSFLFPSPSRFSFAVVLCYSLPKALVCFPGITSFSYFPLEHTTILVGVLILSL